MSSLASCALRSASRQAAAGASLRSASRAALVATRSGAVSSSKRGYVTESKKDHARVETAIKLDKKDFVDIPPPPMGVPADAKVSPMAGSL